MSLRASQRPDLRVRCLLFKCFLILFPSLFFLILAAALFRHAPHGVALDSVFNVLHAAHFVTSIDPAPQPVVTNCLGMEVVLPMRPSRISVVPHDCHLVGVAVVFVRCHLWKCVISEDTRTGCQGETSQPLGTLILLAWSFLNPRSSIAAWLKSRAIKLPPM